MTPEQLKEIEQRWNFVKDRKEPLSGLLSECAKEDIASLLQEVRRLNRMVDNACDLLTMDSMFSADFWRKNLESEVADK